jgi:ABC-2 type transport system permease protein
MRKAVALAVKDLRLLLRDRAGFFFTFFFPLIIAIFFGTIFGGGDEGYQVSVIVVDEDRSLESRAFVDSLASVPVLKIRLSSPDSAATSVRLGRSTAYILIKPGFGEAQNRIFWGPPPSVEIGIDPARKADAAMLEGVLMKVASQRFQRAFSDRRAQRENLDRARTSLGASGSLPPNIRKSLENLFDGLGQFYAQMPESGALAGETAGGSFGAMEPLSIAEVAIGVARGGPKNAYAITFPQGIIWGFIGVTAAFGLSIVTERTGGTLMRLQVSPISRAHILAGKALATFLTTVALSVGLYALGYVVFGVRPDSLPLLAVAVVSSALCFVGIMMLLSVLGKTEQAASGIGWAVLLVFSMLGGGMIPYFIMPSWMRTLSNVSPVKWSILAMEGAVWRHFSLAEMLTPCAVLVGVGAAFFAIGVKVFAWGSDK